MKRFIVIASSGHSGTKWLSELMGLRMDIKSHHELRNSMLRKSWVELDLKEPSDALFDDYWQRICYEEQFFDAVLDANSWPPHLLLKVHEHHEIFKVIYLVRNDIQQLHSLTTASEPLKQEQLPEAAEQKLRILYELMPRKPKADYDAWDNFSKLCLLVAANHFMPEYLAERGMSVEVFHLTRLLHQQEEVRKLVPTANFKTILQLQQKDINRKVEGNRDPSTIWESWPKEKRRSFFDIVCADI